MRFHQEPPCDPMYVQPQFSKPPPPRTHSPLISEEPIIIDMAIDNPTWDYRRITDELAGLGHRVGASTVWRILKHRGLDPAPQRTSVTWTPFLPSQAAVACDFATGTSTGATTSTPDEVQPGEVCGL